MDCTHYYYTVMHLDISDWIYTCLHFLSLSLFIWILAEVFAFTLSLKTIKHQQLRF